MKRIKHNDGYIFIKAPKNWKGKIYSKMYCFEHHYVYWLNTGILPKDGEIIHHQNGIRWDNDFENLRLKKLSEHSREHQMGSVMQQTTKEKLRRINLGKAKQRFGFFASYQRKNRNPWTKVCGTKIGQKYLLFEDPLSCDILYKIIKKERRVQSQVMEPA